MKRSWGNEAPPVLGGCTGSRAGRRALGLGGPGSRSRGTRCGLSLLTPPSCHSASAPLAFVQGTHVDTILSLVHTWLAETGFFLSS